MKGILLDSSDKYNSGLVKSLLRSALLPDGFNQLDMLEPLTSPYYFSEKKKYNRGDVIIIKDSRFDDDESFSVGDMAWFRANRSNGPGVFNRKYWTKLSLFDFVSGTGMDSTITQVSIPDRTDMIRKTIESFATEKALVGDLYKMNICGLNPNIQLALDYPLFDERVELGGLLTTQFKQLLLYLDCYFIDALGERTFIDPMVECVLNFGLDKDPDAIEPEPVVPPTRTVTEENPITPSQNEIDNTVVIRMKLSEFNRNIIKNNYKVLDFPKLYLKSFKVLTTPEVTALKDTCVIIELYAFLIN